MMFRLLAVLHLVNLLCSAFAFSVIRSLPSSSTTRTLLFSSSLLSSSTCTTTICDAGDWANAKKSLQNPNCCVTYVKGLGHHMRILQEYFADKGSADLDLRARVNVSSGVVDHQEQQSSISSIRKDCLSIRRSVFLMDGEKNPNQKEPNINYNDHDSTNDHDDPCTDALVELARGVASLADGPLEETCTGVFIRIVCASDYKALDPMYHTDKAPFRGYVTLRGVGTEFVSRTCSPIEYALLRSSGSGVPVECIQEAEELEFIVMKGDHYVCNDESNPMMKKLWKRAEACVHRSPPAAATGGRRRVIVSLDLADGDDDREWYQANSKREWRSGMTQRKSRLVA